MLCDANAIAFIQKKIDLYNGEYVRVVAVFKVKKNKSFFFVIHLMHLMRHFERCETLKSPF